MTYHLINLCSYHIHYEVLHEFLKLKTKNGPLIARLQLNVHPYFTMSYIPPHIFGQPDYSLMATHEF